MRVHYERAGGFGGPAMRRKITIDTADLPAREADELHRLVRAADLERVSRSLPASPNPRARDQFHYRLTIEDEAGRHTVAVSDPGVPEEVQSLIDWLNERAERA